MGNSPVWGATAIASVTSSQITASGSNGSIGGGLGFSRLLRRHGIMLKQPLSQV